MQECKESKVEMYKPIWGLMFKCNGSGIQFNSHKNITIKEMWKKERKDQTRTQDVMKFGLKMSTSLELSTSNIWDWADTLKIILHL
jgi:hypothetical protein